MSAGARAPWNTWKGPAAGGNPLQRDATPARIAFWEQLVRTCIATPALPLLPADERAIAEAVRATALMPAPLRRLSTVRQNLPKTGENSLHDRLGRWCEGGALGWVFDLAPDRLADLQRDAIVNVVVDIVVQFDRDERGRFISEIHYQPRRHRLGRWAEQEVA